MTAPTEADRAVIDQIIALDEVGRGETARAQMRHTLLSSGDMAGVMIVMAEERDLPYSPDQIVALKGQVSETSRSLYPIPEWTPRDGFNIDKALIFALVRQESCFNAMAKSRVGARGLMQLMPQTAALMARSLNLRAKRSELHEPDLNLTLGQKYVDRLMGLPQVGDNLIMLLIAYNAGPGNLIKWTRNGVPDDDPLFFIDTLPARETRDFVKKVLVNLWVYRSLLGQDNPSLDDLAAGRWTKYKSAD